MCKFTHRLFVFALLLHLQFLGVWRSWTTAAPVLGHKTQSQRLFGELLEQQDYDYDLHYDQRQKGAENLRLKLDGFFIGLPAQDTSGFLLLTDDILEAVGDEMLMGLSKSRSTSTSSSTSSSIVSSTNSAASIFKTTPTFPDNALNEVNKLSTDPSPLSPPLIDVDAIIVDIPASKKNSEARHHIHGSTILSEEEGGGNASRTKNNIIHLLNFFRGNKKV